jgi:hypothetical protein
MIQDLLTILMVCGAVAYTVYSIIKVYTNARQKKSTCGGCSGCTTKERSTSGC